MEQYALSNEQITILKKHGEEFHKWRETEPGKEKIQEHIDHGSYFKLKLAPQNISQITKPELIEIYKHLWASGFWKNKEWKINNIIEKNSLDVIKRELNILLYGKESFEKRYSSFRNKIKGFGISAISEILGMVYPDEFCIWNGKTKKVLTFLNLKKNLPESSFKNNNITGGEYAQCINYLLTIKSELISYQINNFIDLDAFFWYLHENVIPEHWKEESPVHLDEKQQEKLHEAELIKFNEYDTRFWVVRAGGGGEEEKYVLDNNLFTIAWNELSDLSKFKDKTSLMEYYRQIYPDYNEHHKIQAVAQIWDFVNDIRIDDFVLIPLLSRKDRGLAVGRIIGDYNFKELTPRIKHVRSVEWLHKDIPYSEFDEKTRQSLSLHRTVYQIHTPEALNSIKNTLKRYGIIIDTKKQIEKEDEGNNYLLSLEKLSEYLSMPVYNLKVIDELLTDKKQIIFYGPPGTSKTFVAKKFAEYFVNGKKENIEIVQFHPSYSYEDFVEGIKPRLSSEGEATGFIRQPGIFKNLVEKCIKNPNENFVLIIDEINRGNISKIYGELIYLLEYRNEKIRLTYSPNEEFFIPSNLYIIGTMNSADRSIAFVDYALRRRFYFIDFYPDTENQDILKKWFIKNRIKESYQNNVLELMREINTEISNKLGREYQIGYSYFMHSLNYEKVKRIIDYAIIPLVEQYFFGKKESVGIIKNICNTYLIRLQDFEKGKERSLPSSLESFSS